MTSNTISLLLITSVNSLSVTNTTTATSTTTGSLTINGGLGCQGAGYFGSLYSGGQSVLTLVTLYTGTGNISVSSNVISTIASPLFSSLSLTATTVSSSPSTGALTIIGGLGVRK